MWHGHIYYTLPTNFLIECGSAYNYNYSCNYLCSESSTPLSLLHDWKMFLRELELSEFALAKVLLGKTNVQYTVGKGLDDSPV